jgi:hypothetical protein
MFPGGGHVDPPTRPENVLQALPDAGSGPHTSAGRGLGVLLDVCLSSWPSLLYFHSLLTPTPTDTLPFLPCLAFASLLGCRLVLAGLLSVWFTALSLGSG